MSLTNAFCLCAQEMTAVDLACCVAQWIPNVEVFRKYGALPSEEALALAERDTPIMRCVFGDWWVGDGWPHGVWGTGAIVGGSVGVVGHLCMCRVVDADGMHG